jgi:hypothetical protein
MRPEVYKSERLKLRGELQSSQYQSAGGELYRK